MIAPGHPAKQPQSPDSRHSRSSPSPDLSVLGAHIPPNPITWSHSRRQVRSASWSEGHSAPKACLCTEYRIQSGPVKKLVPSSGAAPVTRVCAFQISSAPVSCPESPCDPCDSA